MAHQNPVESLVRLLTELESVGLARRTIRPGTDGEPIFARVEWTLRCEHDDVMTVWTTWHDREPQTFRFDPKNRTLSFMQAPEHMLPHRLDAHAIKLLDHLALVREEGLLSMIGNPTVSLKKKTMRRIFRCGSK